MSNRKEIKHRVNVKKIKLLFRSLFQNFSFKRKLISLFIGGIAVPLLLLNAVYYWQTEKNVQEEMLKKMDEAIEEKSERINSTLADTLSLVKKYYTNETFYSCLDYEYGSDLDYLIQYQDTLQALFSETNLYPYQVRDISIYTNNDTLFSGAHVKGLQELDIELLGEDLNYLNMQAVAGESGIFLRVADESNRWFITSDRRSISVLCIFDHYRQYSKYDKVLRVDLDLEFLADVLSETNLFEDMFLTDSENTVVVAANEYDKSGKMEVLDVAEMEKVVVLSRNIGNYPLTLYGIYDSDIIAQEFQHGRTVSLGISIFCLFFSLILVYAVVENMNKRLYRLVGQSKEIAKGHFVQNKSIEDGNDEFTILENSINLMSVQLRELIEREYIAQIAKAEQEKESNQAKFLALQSQVNPHFMFNALESIRLKAIVKGETETAEIIQYMARMFRNLIEWDNNIISLREEIKFLDEFLFIQNYRFGDEFSYEINVGEAAYECMIPKMILQPVVENACIHGTESVTDDRKIRLNAIVKDGWLKLEVEDNGGGIESQKLQKIRDMLKGEANGGKSVGLWNVYRRLVLYYGDEFEFDINSIQKKGTLCTICIPVRGDNNILGRI